MFSVIVSSRAGDSLNFVVERKGQEIQLTATPELMEQKDPLGNTVKIAVIGVVNNQELGNFRRIEYGPVESVVQAVRESGFIIARTGQFFSRFFAGREDKCQLGGPVKIATMAGPGGEPGHRLADSTDGNAVDRHWFAQFVSLAAA